MFYKAKQRTEKIEATKAETQKVKNKPFEVLNGKEFLTVPDVAFSALTGLRFSDIKNLIWDELEYIEGNGYFIQFKKQKTKGVEMIPISEQAYNLLGESKEPINVHKICFKI